MFSLSDVGQERCGRGPRCDLQGRKSSSTVEVGWGVLKHRFPGEDCGVGVAL